MSSHSTDVTVLTAAEYLRAGPDDWFVAQLTREDQLLMDALTKRGLRVVRRAWDDPAMDWRTTRAAVVRSCWDYFQRYDEFAPWLRRAAGQTCVINSAALIEWNGDKHYLVGMAQRGINIVPTRIVEAGQSLSLQQLCADAGWGDIVIKPAVSASASQTYRIDAVQVSASQSLFEGMLAQGAVLVQPFQAGILEQGELSLIMLGGRYSHAIRKLPKPGDFRVQDDHGGSVQPWLAGDDEIGFAESALAAVPFPADYARVDLIRDGHGKLSLMELEMIEPELFFRMKEGSAAMLADAIARRLGQASTFP